MAAAVGSTAGTQLGSTHTCAGSRPLSVHTSLPLVMKKQVPLSCYDWGCVPPNSHLDILTPGTSECDLVWIEHHEKR